MEEVVFTPVSIGRVVVPTRRQQITLDCHNVSWGMVFLRDRDKRKGVGRSEGHRGLLETLAALS